MNLAAKKRERCKYAVYYLNEWHDKMMMSMPFDVDPLWTVIHEGGPYLSLIQLSEPQRLRHNKYAVFCLKRVA